MRHQKSEQKPELRKSGDRRRLPRKSDEFRRKTRSQALREKQVKTASSSLEFSEVSIKTLHSICAPAVLQQAKKNLQKQQPIKSSRRSSYQLNKRETIPYGFLSSSNPFFLQTSQVHSLEEYRLQGKSHYDGVDTINFPHSSNVADNVPYDDTWLEVFVETHDGIDLVIDLDSNSITDWFLNRNSSILVHPDVADESQKQCVMDSHANHHSEMACFLSSNIEAPSTNTTALNDKSPTFCIASDGDATSQTVQMGAIDGGVPSYNIAEVMDSQESFNSEVKGLRNQEFNFGSLERMPTFFVTGIRRPSAEESEVACNSNCTVACIGA